MADSNAVLERKASLWRRAMGWLGRHQNELWWLHSLYALLLGVGFMWLGKRNFSYLRVAVFHIGFIWLSSFLLPRLVEHPRLIGRWAGRLQLVVNFLNKNLYQQMLFFVLPIYYASATADSPNILFVMLVGSSALLATADIVYDRHLSVRRDATAAFFAFNLFALVNVMLPVVWSVSNTLAMRVGGALAVLGFLTLSYAARSRLKQLARGLLAAFLVIALIEFGRPMIPPAPLRIVSGQVGTDFDRTTLQIVAPMTALPPSSESLRVFGLTAIQAPLGLQERLQHRWYLNGTLIFASPFYNVVGGREEGFRLWTSCALTDVHAPMTLRLEIRTEGGQLVGRTDLRAQRS